MGMSRGRVWLAGVVALVGVGCGDDGDGADLDASSTTVPDKGQGSSSDGEVIEAYVEAMSDGDVDTAMELRCRAGRIAPEERELFESDLQRFTDATGRLAVGRIEVTDTDPRFEPAQPDRGAVELTYWLTFDGDEVDEPLVGIVIDEDGKRRLCAVTTTELARLQSVLPDALADLGPVRPDTLAELMPSSPGPDYRQLTDAQMDPATMPDALDTAVDGWTRSWQHQTYGGVTVSAVRFPSQQDAMEAARRWIARVDQPAVDAFDVPDLRGAQGVRFLGYDWLWLQPPTVGPYVDEVSLVFGDTYVTVAIGGVPTDANHDTAIAQAQAVARLASSAS